MIKKTQLEWLLEAVELKKQNPKLDIHIVTDTSDGASDMQEIKNVEVSPWFERPDESILDDKSDIMEHFENCALDNGISELELKAYCNERYANEVTQAICIYTSEE